MMWPEVETAEREQRHELVLQGKTVAERVDKNDGAVDEKIFSLVKLLRVAICNKYPLEQLFVSQSNAEDL